MIHTAEQQLQEHGGRVSDAERRPAADVVPAVRTPVVGAASDRIRQRTWAPPQRPV
jgi:molecular chaperone DnaK